MKLIIQIPCLNEEDALPATLSELPRRVDGFDEVEWLVIDDGSTDSTVEVARGHGVDHVVRLTNNKGLAAAFQAGLDASLKLGADVIVNTDADNQYRAADIDTLVAPILAGDADMVVGDRRAGKLEHFSRSKRALQRLGSWVVRRASGTSVPDTTSGFRAYNREAALQLQVVSNFTYTLESLIQAGKMLVAVEHVPVGTNPTERGSRLFPSTWNYVRRNAVAIFRAYAMYEPLRVFTVAAVVLAVAADIGAQHKLFPPERIGMLEGPDRDAWQRPDQIMDHLGIAEGSVVADLGAGGGWFTIRLARRVGPRGTVYAQDVQREMLEAIRRRVGKEELQNVQTRLGRGSNPNLPPAALDAVLVVDVYPEVEDRVTFLRNLGASLKPNGRIGIVNYNPGKGGPGPAPEEGVRVDASVVEEDARAAGLRVLSRDTSLPYQYLLVLGK
jgi:predicted methyltransferase